MGDTWLFAVISVIIFAIVGGACTLDLLHNRKPPHNYPRITYACTYFGRYNMTLVNTPDSHDFLGVTKTQFGVITTCRTLIYAVCVTVNGVIVDRIGGQIASIIGALGSGIINVLTGLYLLFSNVKGVTHIVSLTLFFSLNDFFQTFCTTAICKVGVNWYHISERGLFGGIFGIIISFGLYLALQVNALIRSAFHLSSVFFSPGVILSLFSFLCIFVRSTPEDAGWPPVDDSSVEEAEKRKLQASTNIDKENAKCSQEKTGAILTKDYGLPLKELLRLLFGNPVFCFLCVVDFCVGWIRDGVVSFYGMFLKQEFKQNEQSNFFLLASTGVTIGSMFGTLGAGVISDYLCGSRRPPIAFAALILFTFMILIVYFAKVAWVAAVGIGLTSFCFSCVHGIITSACAMDFAGPRATGTAVGILDGIQKIGSALTGVVMGAIYDKYGGKGWLTSLFPASILGALLLIPILKKKGGKKTPSPTPEAETQQGYGSSESDRLPLLCAKE